MGELVDLLAAPGEDTWLGFLRAWYGPHDRDARAEPSRGPARLRRFWSEVGAWSGAIVQNRLVFPDDAELEDDRILFYVENQDVAVWSTLLTGDDPPVWYRREDDRSDWQQEGEPLSRFLLQLVLFEATIGSRCTLSVVDRTPSQVAAVTANFVELPLAPWLFPTGEMRFFARDGALAFLEPGQPGAEESFELFVAARRRDDLEFLRPLVDSEWILSDALVSGFGWHSE